MRVLVRAGEIGRSIGEGARALGIGVRQVQRLKKALKEEGPAGLAHGNRGSIPKHTLMPQTVASVVDLYEAKYQGFNFTHFTLDGSPHDWLEGRGPRMCCHCGTSASHPQSLIEIGKQVEHVELERELTTIKAQLSIVRTKLKDARPEPMDVERAQQIFAEFATVFPDCTEEERERLVDFIVKKAVVQKDKAVDFEFYAMEDGADVVQYVEVGSPALAIGQHRSRRTICVQAQAESARVRVPHVKKRQ